MKSENVQIIYGLYKGDEFLDVGTAEELANKLGVKKTTIQYYATPSCKRKVKNTKSIVAVKFKENIQCN